MNEAAAIKFLRALIQADPGTLDDGRLDPGWCCQEHAVIASLAFALAGGRPQFCEGAVMLGQRTSLEIMDVNPHFFLLMEERGTAFDSSVTIGPFNGIATIPHRELCVWGGDEQPSRATFTSRLSRQRETYLAWYHSKKRFYPPPSLLEWESTSQFGRWLFSRFQSQIGLWGRAAFAVAGILKGRPTGRISDRGALWDSIAATPDRNEDIRNALARLCD